MKLELTSLENATTSLARSIQAALDDVATKWHEITHEELIEFFAEKLMQNLCPRIVGFHPDFGLFFHIKEPRTDRSPLDRD